MENFYSILIQVWNYIKDFYSNHPIIINLVGAIILLPVAINIITNIISKKIENNRDNKDDIKNQIKKADIFFESEKYKEALEEYIKLECNVKGRSLQEVLFNKGKCYFEIAKKNKRNEENLKLALLYFQKGNDISKNSKIEKLYLVYDVWAHTYIQLSLIREKTYNLKKAIELLKKAMEQYRLENKKGFKKEYEFLELENSLATCYENLAEEENEVNNLNYALFIYISISRENENLPEDMAWKVLNNLGRIYEKMARIDERDKNLKEALRWYNESLSIRGVEKYPEDYALVSNNLGNIYLNLSELESEEENLKKAITFYDSALKVYDLEDYPRDYAKVKNNIGSANLELFKVSGNEDYLKESIVSLEESLKYRSIRSNPIDFAATSANLGRVYMNKGKINKSIEYIDLAINAFNDALKIFNGDGKSNISNYIYVKNNIGIAYRIKGEITKNSKYFLESVNNYTELLENYSINKSSYIYNIILENINESSKMLQSTKI